MKAHLITPLTPLLISCSDLMPVPLMVYRGLPRSPPPRSGPTLRKFYQLRGCPGSPFLLTLGESSLQTEAHPKEGLRHQGQPRAKTGTFQLALWDPQVRGPRPVYASVYVTADKIYLTRLKTESDRASEEVREQDRVRMWFGLVIGSHLTIQRGYSQLCAQRLFPALCSGITPGPVLLLAL